MAPYRSSRRPPLQEGGPRADTPIKESQMSTRTIVLTIALAGLVVVPQAALAQGFGIGPRFSFVRGDVPSDAPSTRFLGGTIRMSSSRRVVLEAAMDYRTERSEDGLTRLRE